MVLKLHHRVNIVKAYRSEPPVCVRTGRECMAVLKTYASKGLMYKAEKQTVHKKKKRKSGRAGTAEERKRNQAKKESLTCILGGSVLCIRNNNQ